MQHTSTIESTLFGIKNIIEIRELSKNESIELNIFNRSIIKLSPTYLLPLKGIIVITTSSLIIFSFYLLLKHTLIVLAALTFLYILLLFTPCYDSSNEKYVFQDLKDIFSENNPKCCTRHAAIYYLPRAILYLITKKSIEIIIEILLKP